LKEKLFFNLENEKMLVVTLMIFTLFILVILFLIGGKPSITGYAFSLEDSDEKLGPIGEETDDNFNIPPDENALPEEGNEPLVDLSDNASNENNSINNSEEFVSSDSDFLREEIYITKDFLVSLVSQSKFLGSFENDFIFYYYVDGEENITSCELYINGNVTGVQYSVKRGVTNNFSLYDLSPGIYSWKIICEDFNENISISSENKVKIFHTFYGIESSLINVEDVENVRDLFFKNEQYGQISFEDSINLSSADNLSNYIFFGDNLIGIDSENAPYLNKPAILSLFNLPFENPIILRNGEPCLDCDILSYDGNLVFRVEHFSNYSASENSLLRIWDESDLGTVYVGENVTFFANYSNVTSSSSILGASCTINFADGSFSMDYNSTSNLYEYVRNFSSPTIYSYNVSCSASGYTSFNLIDEASIGNSGNRVRGASVTSISNSTAAPDLASPHVAIAGNVTEITVTGVSTTQSWQGYYGNVSGTIELGDASGNAMYNWSVTSAVGEVFSSVEPIDWNTITCFDMVNVLLDLESEYGLGASDIDGVDETFNLNNHPEFYVGSVQFSFGECYNTKVFGPGGAATFDEVLLMDNSNRTVFTSLLNNNVEGFDGFVHDFEMLVLENGHEADTEITSYFFYIELG